MQTESSPQSAHEAQPYPPSFVDRLMAWVERLPGPAWGLYLLATAVIVALAQGLRWLDDSKQIGTFSVKTLASESTMIYALAALHLLNATARRSLADFRPALGKLEVEYEKLRYELTTLSPRFAQITTGIGILLVVLVVADDRGRWTFQADSSLATIAFRVCQTTLLVVSFTVFISQMIRQTRLIAYIHRSATNISLYESDSHHAFSRLTVRAALALAFPTYYFLFSYYWKGNRIIIPSALEASLFLFAILASAAVFILPLLGMRRRLVAEKSRLMVESDRRFAAAARMLHERVDGQRLEKMDDLNKTLASLILEKETLQKISTWPWEAQTMRGFLSSVGLPILLWFTTTYLAKFFQ